MTDVPDHYHATRNAYRPQKGHFDWILLRDGNVFRYKKRSHVDDTCDELSSLGYTIIKVNLGECQSIEEIFDSITREMNLPVGYVRNLDALSDAFDGIAQLKLNYDKEAAGTAVALYGFDTLVNIDHFSAHYVLDSFAQSARVASMFSHPMLCIAETESRDLGPVGGYNVNLGALAGDRHDMEWNTDKNESVEFEFEIESPTIRNSAAILESSLASFRRDYDIEWRITTETLEEESKFPGRISVMVHGNADADEIENLLREALRSAGVSVGGSSMFVHPPNRRGL